MSLSGDAGPEMLFHEPPRAAPPDLSQPVNFYRVGGVMRREVPGHVPWAEERGSRYFSGFTKAP